MTIWIDTDEGPIVLVPWVAAFLIAHWQRTMVVVVHSGKGR